MGGLCTKHTFSSKAAILWGNQYFERLPNK